jgi:hypothetical protein
MEEIEMARIVGWVFITAFALYGLERFVSNHVVLDADPGSGAK